MPQFIFCLLFFVLGKILPAAEFYIENEIRVGEKGKSVKSFSFLLNGDFISIIGENGEVTFFDAKNQVFTLLDPALRIQTQIDAADTKRNVELKREQILAHSGTVENFFFVFAAKPQFQQQEYDDVSGNLGLQSPWIDYELKTAALPNAEIAKQYFDFCDWNCYLNLRLNPHSASMLVRQEVDRILREKNRYAVQVSVSLYPKGKGLLTRPDTAHSVHSLGLRLDDTAKKRIVQVEELRRTLPQVSFAEYQQKVAEKQ